MDISRAIYKTMRRDSKALFPGAAEALTFPQNTFLCTDICLQLCCSYIDPDRLREVADSLGHDSLGCIPRLKPSSF